MSKVYRSHSHVCKLCRKEVHHTSASGNRSPQKHVLPISIHQHDILLGLAGCCLFIYLVGFFFFLIVVVLLTIPCSVAKELRGVRVCHTQKNSSKKKKTPQNHHQSQKQEEAMINIPTLFTSLQKKKEAST